MSNLSDIYYFKISKNEVILRDSWLSKVSSTV